MGARGRPFLEASLSDVQNDLLRRMFQTIPESERDAFLREILATLPPERIRRIVQDHAGPDGLAESASQKPASEPWMVGRNASESVPARPVTPKRARPDHFAQHEPHVPAVPSEPNRALLDFDDELKKIRSSRNDIAQDTKRQLIALLLWGVAGLVGFAALTYLSAKGWGWLQSLF